MTKKKDLPFMPMDRMLYTRAAMTGRIPPGMTLEGFTEKDKQARSRAERRREVKQIRKDVAGLRRKEKYRG